MIPDTPNPASAAARTGFGNDVYFGGEQFPDSASLKKYQAKNLVRRFVVRHLRLVPPVPPPRRLLAVRINVLDGRSSFGRSRVFRLAESDIDELIAIATRMERRLA